MPFRQMFFKRFFSSLVTPAVSRGVMLSVVAALFCCACGRQDSIALQEFDKVLSDSHLYEERFESQMDSVKRHFPSGASDSLRWVFANRMYEIYRYYDIDTTWHYVQLMEELSARTGDPDQQSLTDGARIRLMRSKDNYYDAIELFESMDTVGLKPATIRKYYSTGVTLYQHTIQYNKQSEQLHEAYSENLERLRREYESRFFSTSTHCRYMTALAYRDRGDSDKALSILTGMLREDDLTMRELALVTYYISTVYDRLGDSERRNDWLIKSATYELQVPIHDYSALFDLAISRLEEGDFRRASTYMDKVLQGVLSMNMVELLYRASAAYATIAKAANRSEQSKSRMLLLGMVFLGIFASVTIVLLLYTWRQSGRLKKAYALISSINRSLKDSNQIKDSYVARYMKLSTYYIRQVDETRKELRKVAKSGGLEAVVTLLRSPLYADAEYKRFYRIFDDTFMGLFPHFVEKVNELLPPEAGYYVKDNQLNTELRILAVIRLGISKSPEIAEVLNCSVRTVYKYRFNLRSIALCPKDEFEKRICQIDF